MSSDRTNRRREIEDSTAARLAEIVGEAEKAARRVIDEAEEEARSRLIDARDIGVSYFVVGIVGVLTYHVPRRWRWVYLVGAVAVFGVSLAVKRDFTQLGHFSALLIGLACYPLARALQRGPSAA